MFQIYTRATFFQNYFSIENIEIIIFHSLVGYFLLSLHSFNYLYWFACFLRHLISFHKCIPANVTLKKKREEISYSRPETTLEAGGKIKFRIIAACLRHKQQNQVKHFLLKKNICIHSVLSAF